MSFGNYYSPPNLDPVTSFLPMPPTKTPTTGFVDSLAGEAGTVAKYVKDPKATADYVGILAKREINHVENTYHNKADAPLGDYDEETTKKMLAQDGMLSPGQTYLGNLGNPYAPVTVGTTGIFRGPDE